MLRKDPLLHFLVIGGLLFVTLSWLGRTSAPMSPQRIVITAEQVAELARSAELLQGRPPTDEELQDLVREAVREEVYYRRALALELDVNDDEVRRRLVEKMQYLTEDTADPDPPQADVEAYFAANAAQFRIPELVTFDQVFFSPRMRGDSVLTDADESLQAMQGGASPEAFGDSTPLDGRFEAADPERVRILFGEALTEAVFAEAMNVWLGPFESDFGWHLVRIIDRRSERDPQYAEVEVLVHEAYAAQRLERANETAFAQARAYFDIAVQWEAGKDAEVWP